MISARDKILRYLGRWPSGLPSAKMRAWIDSCRKGGGYTPAEYEQALIELRSAGVIACTNGIWWLKDVSTTMREAETERVLLSKQRRELKNVKN